MYDHLGNLEKASYCKFMYKTTKYAIIWLDANNTNQGRWLYISYVLVAWS